jgi:drug/metabolite transporter (DMT)-like permease
MDKFLIEKGIKNPMVLTIIVRGFYILPALFVLPFVGYSLPPLESLAIIAVGAVMITGGAVLYFRALKMEEMSRVVPLFQMVPVFVMVLSFLLINEVLTTLDYIGFAVIILGGLVISTEKFSEIHKVKKVFWVCALSSLLTAIYVVAIKHVSSSVSYWNMLITIYAFEAIAMSSLLVSGKVRRDTGAALKKSSGATKIILVVDVLTSFMISVLLYLAITSGPVTLVEASVNNLQMIFTFLLLVLFTSFWPHIIREKFHKQVLAQKILGTAIIVTGVIITQLL